MSLKIIIYKFLWIYFNAKKPWKSRMSDPIDHTPPSISPEPIHGKQEKKQTWKEWFSVLQLKIGHVGRYILGKGKDSTYTERILNSFANGSIRFQDLYKFGSYSVNLSVILHKICNKGETCGLPKDAIDKIKINFRDQAIQATIQSLKPDTKIETVFKVLLKKADVHANDKTTWESSIEKSLPKNIDTNEFSSQVETTVKSLLAPAEKSKILQSFKYYPSHIQFAVYSHPDISNATGEELRIRMFAGWSELSTNSPQDRFQYLGGLKKLAEKTKDLVLRDRILKFEAKFKEYISTKKSNQLDFQIEQYLHMPSEKFDPTELVNRCVRDEQLEHCIDYATKLKQYDPTTAANCDRLIQDLKQVLENQ